MSSRQLHTANRPFRYDRGGALRCDEVQIPGLADRHGTPLYVYSASAIRARLGLFRSGFAGLDHLVCYAVKACSNLSILGLIAREGAGFDIVSGGELARVLRAAGKRAAARTVFSGVGKTADEMDEALRAGILLFNVESEGELEVLAERAARCGTKARIALRVNPDVFAETHPYISTGMREHKFGIDMQVAPEVYRRAARSRWLDPVGISVHIGSQIRSAEPFGAAVGRAVELVRDLRREGIALKTVDAGGGVGIDYHEALCGGAEPASFNPAAAIGAYAAALRTALRAEKVRLLLEPGRFLVAQAGALIARVLYVKQNGEKRFVITDAAMNDLIRPALYGAHHEIVPVRRDGLGSAIVADITGPVCETGDFFARDRRVPALSPGDLLAILDTGAYGMSLSSNYNSRPRAAEVLVDGHSARLIRRRETMKDLLRGE
jgi:diaminopimelate decarboxylase